MQKKALTSFYGSARGSIAHKLLFVTPRASFHSSKAANVEVSQNQGFNIVYYR